jgi:hypothetical protein
VHYCTPPVPIAVAACQLLIEYMYFKLILFSEYCRHS